MISAREMAVVDANAGALGVPRKQLMESSGNAVARVVRELIDPPATVALICGRGNNGGDAAVAARFLADETVDVSVRLLGRPRAIGSRIARENWTALERGGYDTRVIRDSRELALTDPTPDLVVDAVLGTGVRGAPREPARSAIRSINALDVPVVSVDVPSGINADTGKAPGVTVASDHVVTFHATKPGLASLEVPVTVADIGIPRAAEQVVERGDLGRRERAPTSHKGDHGEVLVIGGGPYTGAPALAARAALRAGADLVRVACPETVADAVQGYGPDLIVRPTDGQRFTPATVDAVADLAAGHDVVLIGPGLGDATDTRQAVAGLLERYDGPAVVDADALQAVPEADRTGPTICTPHAGEFDRMAELADVAVDVPPGDDADGRAETATTLADALGVIITLKGRYDAIADGRSRDPPPREIKPPGMNPRRNRSGCAQMTVGGTGDVLAGATAALTAVLDPFDAACVAVHANGLAGERAAADRASILASDMLEQLPAVLAPPSDDG